MELIERKISEKLRKVLVVPEIIVLTGMRRVGKTTVLKMLFNEIKSDNKIFLDMDNLLDRRVFEHIDYNQTLQGLKAMGLKNEKDAYVFIDEIQSYPESVKVLKYLYDHYQIKFIVTGSSSFYLKNLFPESLAGRKLIFELFPLDFSEFLLFKGISINNPIGFKDKASSKHVINQERLSLYIEEYIEWGGFPQVVLATDVEYKKRIISDIFSSYYQKDILQLADFKNLRAFRELLMLLMQRVGSRIEITRLATEAGISRDSVYSYLSFLESTYMISLLKTYGGSVDREVRSMPKLYFCDNGILSVFGKIARGSLLENAVYCQLKSRGKVQYFQKKNGQEIDFILPDEGIAIEVKSQWNELDYKKLLRLSSELKIPEAYLLTNTYNDHPACIPFSIL